MKRAPKKSLPPVSCVAVVRRTGGFVYLRVHVNAGAIVIRHTVPDALTVADAIRGAVAFAQAHAQLTVELSLPSGESLVLAVDRAASVADELTTGASRATGVRA